MSIYIQHNLIEQQKLEMAVVKK